jgi:hypothetical protein
MRSMTMYPAVADIRVTGMTSVTGLIPAGALPANPDSTYRPAW